MSGEGKQFKLNLRLPKVLEEHVRSFAAEYELSLNDAVKFTLIQHHLHSQFGPVHGPVHGAKIEQTEEIQNGPVDGPTGGAKKTRPSRVRDKDMSNNMSKHKDIYLINSNNNTIVFQNSETQEIWKRFKKYRKEIKKPITASNEIFQQRYIDRVLKYESEAKLVERFETAMANSWQGFIWPDEKLEGEIQAADKYEGDDL